MKFIAPVILCFFSSTLYALPAYYGNLQWSSSQQLKDELFQILSSFHQPQASQPDIIGKSCNQTLCYTHSSVGYKKAREHLFGNLFLNGNSPSNYSILTAYCHTYITNEDLSPSDPLSPMNIPDPKVINAEHTWPQSKFTKKFPEDLQKSDLHILLPELSNVNSQRSNHPFGNVQKQTSSLCQGSALGKSAENQTVFEPHDSAKGDVARALFYYSIRYQSPIDSHQEAYLRLWHQQDPIDSEEVLHNEEIFKIQKNRNPFIDDPTFVQEISDF